MRPSGQPTPRTLRFYLEKLLRGQGLVASVARGTAIVFTIQVAGLALTYVAQVALARVLGAREYGIYRYAWSWINLLGILATLGFPTALQRFVPEYRTRGEPDLARGLLRGARWTTFLASLVAAAAAALVFDHAAGTWLEPDHARALVFGCWIIPVVTALTLNTQVARSFHRMVAAFLPFQLGRPAAGIATAAIIAAGITAATGQNALLILGTGLALLLLAQAAWVVAITPPDVRHAGARSDWQQWLAVSLPLLLMTGFGLLLNQLGVLMVGSMLGPTEAGIFSAATQLAMLVSFFLTSVNNVVAPRISELWHSGRKDELQRLLAIVVHWIFWPSLACAAVLFFGRSWIMGLFGKDFVTGPGPTVLAILLLGHLVNAGAGSVGLIMNVTGHQNLNAMVYGATAVLNIALNILLLPVLGVTGGAVAMASTMMLWNVALVLIVSRRLRLATSIAQLPILLRAIHRPRS